MQQRFAFALLIRLSKSPNLDGEAVETFHGTVQAADAPEASHFTSLRQLERWIENALPPTRSLQPSPMPTSPMPTDPTQPV